MKITNFTLLLMLACSSVCIPAYSEKKCHVIKVEAYVHYIETNTVYDQEKRKNIDLHTVDIVYHVNDKKYPYRLITERKGINIYQSYYFNVEHCVDKH